MHLGEQSVIFSDFILIYDHLNILLMLVIIQLGEKYDNLLKNF